jgi:TIR domain
MENEHDIFISYSDKDRELARKVYDALVAEGFNCWISL